MNPETLIRAWKDPEFRASLSPEQLQALPENPSGKPMTELGDDELTDAVGGGGTLIIRPTPPIFLTRGGSICNKSAVDACPTRWGCDFQTTVLERISPAGF